MFRKKKTTEESILILGLGVIGLYLAKRLVYEGYAVTVIEPDSELIRYADENLDARLITGSAMSIACWQEANAAEIDFILNSTGEKLRESRRYSIVEREMNKQDISLSVVKFLPE